jgi:xanthine dehydrogenase small subunit
MPVTVRTFASAAEAASALAGDRGARYLAGGTLVMRALNEGDVSVATVIRATDGALQRIDTAGARVTLGAGVTLSRILAERDLAFLHPVARAIGGPAIRNMGTVGGNLFAPSPYGDLTVALLALDAVVAVQGGFGSRETPLEEFLAGRDRMGSSLVLSVSFPRPASPEAFRFRKVSRVKPKGSSVVSLAVSLPMSGGRIQGARVALGAMGPTPLRAKGAERTLDGRSLDPPTAAAAAAAVLEGTHPVDDALASAWYRREVAGAHLRRLLLGEA